MNESPSQEVVMGRNGCPPALIAAGRPVVKATCIYFPHCPLATPTDGLPSMGFPKGQVLAAGQLGSIDGGPICE